MLALVRWLVAALVVVQLFDRVWLDGEIRSASLVSFALGAGLGWVVAVMTISYRSWMSNRRRWWTGRL